MFSSLSRLSETRRCFTCLWTSNLSSVALKGERSDLPLQSRALGVFFMELNRLFYDLEAAELV